MPVVATLQQVNGMFLRPFREKVDIETVILLLVLWGCVTGMWHLVLERIEL